MSTTAEAWYLGATPECFHVSLSGHRIVVAPIGEGSADESTGEAVGVGVYHNLGS